MDIHHFFEGDVREEAASAFLATLLEQDAGFRSAFVRRVGGDAGGAMGRATVRVEFPVRNDRWADVLLELLGLVVLVENKIRPFAVRQGQLAGYYGAAVGRWPERRIITVFLAPDERWGRAEARRVRRDARRLERDDLATSLGWNHVRWLLRFATNPDAHFRRSGMRAIDRALESYARRGRSASPANRPRHRTS